MDADEDSAGSEEPKRSLPDKHRFRLKKEEGKEPEAWLPDLGQREVKIEKQANGKTYLIIVLEDKERHVSIPRDTWLSEAGVNEKRIEDLGEQFGIINLPLLRVVLTCAAFSGRESKDYAVLYPNKGRLSADADEFELLCRADRYSRLLERALSTALVRGKQESRAETTALLAQHPAGQALRAALEDYGRFISRLEVSHLPRRPSVPRTLQPDG
jgi:hypothetical protein